MDEDDNDPFYFHNNCLQLKSICDYKDFFSATGGVDVLKVFHCNIRSISKNLDELIIFLNELPTLDIIVLSECWLQEGGEGQVIEGFEVVFTDKRRNRADGVTIYYNKRLTVTTSQISLGDVYGLNLQFNFASKTFYFLAFYRTFDCNVQFFLDSLEQYLITLSKNAMLIWSGDLNFDLLDQTPSAETDRYLDCLAGAGLLQFIDKPTRVTTNSKTCLDHFFLRYNDFNNVHSALSYRNN